MGLGQIWQHLRRANWKQLLMVLRAVEDDGQELGRSMDFAQMPSGSWCALGSKKIGSAHSASRWLSQLRYKGHTIRSCPLQEVNSYVWVASAVIFEDFRCNAKAVSVEVWLSRLVLSEKAAEARAVAVAKQWIDDKVLSRQRS